MAPSTWISRTGMATYAHLVHGWRCLATFLTLSTPALYDPTRPRSAWVARPYPRLALTSTWCCRPRDCVRTRARPCSRLVPRRAATRRHMAKRQAQLCCGTASRRNAMVQPIQAHVLAPRSAISLPLVSARLYGDRGHQAQLASCRLRDPSRRPGQVPSRRETRALASRLSRKRVHRGRCAVPLSSAAHRPAWIDS